MESIGKFEFNRKDLIGHGAFAVVFKGRHKENHDWEVAVKCINKKNLSKSQSLLGKEIKILKELKHDNIVGLLDFQEMGGCVYLVMEYCNGGDLADYLHSKGTLSEDTIRGFLLQIAGAMRVLKNKGILHRDLKPQNILLCHPEGRRSSPNNTCIKIADFGFARHLQINTMAATLCGSPMYMAPEVIMSQNYDAKADLWSIGTIVYQCLTGKAPFQASTPQELRLFYERNRSLLPSIPRETSSHLRHLLLGLLQKNHKERMDFDTFFHHPFLESTSTTKKSLPAVPVPVPSSPITASDCSSSSSSNSHPASPQHSNAEMQRLLAKSPPSPTQDSPGLLLKAPANQNSRIATSDIEDFVMVPAQFPGEPTCEMGDGSPVQGSMISSTPVEFGGSNYGQSVAIPVPTQLHNYQRMEQNLQPAGLRGSTRAPLCRVGSRGGSPPGCERPSSPAPELISRRLSAGGARPPQPSPLAGTVPESPEQTCPLSTRTEQLAGSPDSERPPISGRNIQRRDSTAVPPFEFSLPPSPPNLPSGPGASPLAATLRPACRVRTAPDLKSLGLSPATPPLGLISRNTAKRKGSFRRSLSTARLSDMLLKTAFGPQLLEGGTDDSLDAERPMDITAPPSGPDGVVFTVGCPSRRNTLPNIAPTRTHSGLDYPDHVSSFSSRLQQRGARRDSETSLRQRHSDPRADRCVTFEPPELPEETLMGQDHTDGLSHLRFTLAFVHCVMEIACSKDSGLEASDSADVSFLQQSLVADQISLLSREWSYAEQLVLYMKAAECLSSALRAAMEDIRQGRLLPSSTVKQAVRKLNDLYKSSVASCRSLSARLRGFLFSKQRLMEHMSDVTAEKLIYSHTVHMVQSAALDEMFHRGQASMQRYHKALLLMEGLSMVITEQADIDNISKCKQCIERRLSALQTAQCV